MGLGFFLFVHLVGFFCVVFFFCMFDCVCGCLVFLVVVVGWFGGCF